MKRVTPFMPAILVLILVSETAQPHPGGLNAQGCHNSRKTGDYHCHRPQTPPQSSQSLEQRLGSSPSDRVFANCTEARAAGSALVRRGQPGYGPHLDRDGAGVGCE